MVKFVNVSKSFKDVSGHENALIRNLNLHFKPGDFAVIIGANGSGKSTLLNLIAGSDLPDSGKILVNEQEVQTLKNYERSNIVSRIFQNPLQGSVAALSVIENMRLAFLRGHSKGLKVGVNKDFKEFVKEKIFSLNLGLENKMEQKMGTLSGGQRQALTLVMATLNESKILLMDEPTAALDPKSALSLMENACKIIEDRKLTAIMVSHNLREASSYGNRLLMLHTGNIVKDLDHKNKLKVTATDLFEWLQ